MGDRVEYTDYRFGMWFSPTFLPDSHKPSKEAADEASEGSKDSVEEEEEKPKLSSEAHMMLVWHMTLAKMNFCAAVASDINIWADKVRMGDANRLTKAGAYVVHLVSLPILAAATIIEGLVRQALALLLVPFYYLRPPTSSSKETEDDDNSSSDTESTASSETGSTTSSTDSSEDAAESSKTLDDRYMSLRSRVETYSELLSCGLSSAFTLAKLNLSMWFGGLNPFYTSIEMTPSFSETSFVYVPPTTLALDGFVSTTHRLIKTIAKDGIYFEGHKYKRPESNVVFNKAISNPAWRALLVAIPEKVILHVMTRWFDKDIAKEAFEIYETRNVREFLAIQAQLEKEDGDPDDVHSKFDERVKEIVQERQAEQAKALALRSGGRDEHPRHHADRGHHGGGRHHVGHGTRRSGPEYLEA